MAPRWLMPEPSYSHGLQGLPALARQVLAARGLQTEQQVREFLDRADPGHDPFRLPGMDIAIERIRLAAERGERVAVYGDYDADGITATAILVLALQAVDVEAIAYLPDRFAEGYGVRIEGLEALQSQGVGLVITVDCGVRSIAEVAWAQARGMDVIVSDHHLAGPSLPPALAVIDPLRHPAEYPYAGLSGAGVAYKLVQALAERLPGRLDPERLVDLVAIGTVADLAPLDGENRSLVARGLDRMRSAPRPGLQELLRVAGVTPGALTATGIAFSVAPRLNAAGRMDSPRPAFELLIAEQASVAAPLAAGLEQANRERQAVTRREFERARDQVLALGRVPPLLAVLSTEMGEGILGLVAARLTEEFYRPSLVARLGPEVVRASLRSIPEFPITAALEQIAERLLEFGGHTTAAGFSARPVELDEIVATLERMAGPVMAEDPSRQIRVDAVARLDELDADLLGFLDQLEPTGQGNPPVVFAGLGVEVLSKRAVGTDGAHLKLLLREGAHAFDAIAFRQGHRLSELPRRVDVLFRLERNRYLGVETLQLNVKDLRPASPQTGI